MGILDAPAYSRKQADSFWGPLKSRTFCQIGDSITDYDRDPLLPLNQASDWGTRLQQLSGGALILAKNAAVGGRTTAQVLAGIDSELAGQTPALVTDLSGTNNARSLVPLSTFVANKIAIRDKVRGLGAQYVTATVPPAGVSALPTPAAPTLEVLSTGGNLGPGTYSYRVTSRRVGVESDASPAATITIPSGAGSTNSIAITPAHVKGAAEYGIYGRTAGAEKKIAGGTSSNWNGAPQRQYVDTGAATPGANPPATNGTAIAPLQTGTLPLIASYNAWLRRWCADNGILLLDFHRLLVNPADGQYLPQSTRDGVHPEPYAEDAMARLAWDALKPKALASFKRTAAAAVDASSFAINPVFLTDTSGYALSPSSGTNPFTLAREARAGFDGFAAHLAVTGINQPSNGLGFQSSNTVMPATNYAAGDVLELAFKLEIANNLGARVVFTALERTTNATLWQGSWKSDLPQSEIVQRIPAPTNDLIVSVRAYLGTCDVYFGEFAVRNLTRLGVL